MEAPSEGLARLARLGHLVTLGRLVTMVAREEGAASRAYVVVTRAWVDALPALEEAVAMSQMAANLVTLGTMASLGERQAMRAFPATLAAAAEGSLRNLGDLASMAAAAAKPMHWRKSHPLTKQETLATTQATRPRRRDLRRSRRR